MKLWASLLSTYLLGAAAEYVNETSLASSFNLNEANKHLWLSAAGMPVDLFE
jgi:hypothetical protein